MIVYIACALSGVAVAYGAMNYGVPGFLVGILVSVILGVVAGAISGRQTL